MIKAELKKILKSQTWIYFMILVILINLFGIFVFKSWEPITKRFDSASSYATFMTDITQPILAIFFIYLTTKNVGEEYQLGTVKQFFGFLTKRSYWVMIKFSALSLTMIVTLVIRFASFYIIGTPLFGLSGSEETFSMTLVLNLTQLPLFLFLIMLGILLSMMMKSNAKALITELPFYFGLSFIQTLLAASFKKKSEFLPFFHLEPRAFLNDPYLAKDLGVSFNVFNLPLSLLYFDVILVILYTITCMIVEKQDI